MNLAAIVAIDAGAKLDATNGVKVNTGNTQYCLQDTVGSFSAYYVGPAGGAGSWTATNNGPVLGTCP
jgi:hypothetical protein